MKDWKFIKIGNTDTPELRERLRDIEEQIKNWEHGKEVKGINKENAKKIIEDLRKERATIKSEIATGNESIDKQEWSMFKGLTKDAEKEIGNDESELIKRGFVYKVIIPGKKPIYFNNPRQAQIAAEAQKGTVERVGNKKTGNEDTDEMEVKYKGYTITYFPYQKKYMVRHPNEVSGLVQKHFASVEEAKKSIDKKIGNRVCNESVKETNISGKNGSGVITRMNNLYFVAYNLSNGEKGIEKFQTESQANDFLKKKVGNEKRYMPGDAIKVTLPGGRVIQAIVTKDEGNVIKYVTKIDDDGNPIGSEQIALRSEVGNKTQAVAQVGQVKIYYDDTDQVYYVNANGSIFENPSFKTKEEAIKFAQTKQTGNKIGNSDSQEEYWKKQFIESARKKGWSEKNIQDFVKKIEKEGAKSVLIPMKTGNDGTNVDNMKRARNAMTVADLKAQIKKNEEYIKSLAGKSVDGEGWPAEDAISEAQDEIDRMKARIAELQSHGNKKVKNSSVREYKDSQGRIAQIDFNSDGTDADMAIYEDEKMSKSVEQRNFSTIRDAEQYVQSHGFRRVG